MTREQAIEYVGTSTNKQDFGSFPDMARHTVECFTRTIYDEFEARTCSTCKWWQDEVCVNGDSPLCSDFTVGKYGCNLWGE